MSQKPKISIDEVGENIVHSLSFRPLTILELSKEVSRPVDVVYLALKRLDARVRINKRKYELR